MDFNNLSIGVDIEEVDRFVNKDLSKDEKFLKKIFTDKELEYCFSKKFSEQNLCGRYCAKEAVVKALTGLAVYDVYYSDIEIINSEKGEPVCTINKYPDISIKLSISHTKNYAAANVLLCKINS